MDWRTDVVRHTLLKITALIRKYILRVRGELGILKKKFSSAQRDLGEQKDNIKLLSNDVAKLESKINSLEKDKVNKPRTRICYKSHLQN